MNIQKLKEDGMIKELVAEQRAKLNITSNIINNYLAHNISKLDIKKINELLSEFMQLEDEIKSIRCEITK